MDPKTEEILQRIAGLEERFSVISANINALIALVGFTITHAQQGHVSAHDFSIIAEYIRQQGDLQGSRLRDSTEELQKCFRELAEISS